MLDVPDGLEAYLFDLDGVLTRTAKVHAAAWKEMFDGFLRERAERAGEPFHEFELPADEVHALGARKNDLVRGRIHRQGVERYEGSVRFVEAARERGLRRAVV